MDEQRFIVAEISKNWDQNDWQPPLVSQLFEEIINKNAGRGYRLQSFQLHRYQPDPRHFNETIIAVFERDPALTPKEELP